VSRESLELILIVVLAITPPLAYLLFRILRWRRDVQSGSSEVSDSRGEISDHSHSSSGRSDSVSMNTLWQMQRLRALVDTLNDGIAVVEGSGHIAHTNHAFRTMFDIDSDAAENLRVVAGGSLQPLMKFVAEVLEQGEPSLNHRVELSPPRQHEMVFHVDALPLRDPYVRFPEVVLVLRDVTALHHVSGSSVGEIQYHRMIGRSPGMQQVFALLRDLSAVESNVLITGESGTGKELVAEAVHYSSPRSDGPFIRVNCAALSENLLETELFGHVRGAYTGAIADRVGRFEAAQGGTLFLDEIGDISSSLQTKLLRVIQLGEFERVGETRTIHTDARIIAATNRNLAERMESGQFRRDLYYRLDVLNVHLPPLRDRREDIPLLTKHFLDGFSITLGKKIEQVSEEAMRLLLDYDWPGNVRELENALHRAAILCDKNELQPRHLPEDLRIRQTPQSATRKSSRGTKNLNRDVVLEALMKQEWVIARAARQLGISRNYLYQKMREHEIRRPEQEQAENSGEQ
jgi:PAS domain S-box-containing protein